MVRQRPAQNPQASEVHRRVTAQFGASAAAYTVSATHSDPGSLRKIVELAAPRPTDVALDIATGAGHTALALAPCVAQVVAFDLTEPMLAETRRNAAARGLVHVRTQQGTAESLPFADASFDIVTVRQAPHHFADVRAAVREMARVARPGARVVIVDSTSPEDDAIERQWNHIEKLRDSSHVRNYRPTEWRAFVAAAGLRVTFEQLSAATENGGPMNFDAWLHRLNPSPQVVAEVTRLFREASPALTAALRIQCVDGRFFFCVPQFTIAARKG